MAGLLLFRAIAPDLLGVKSATRVFPAGRCFQAAATTAVTDGQSLRLLSGATLTVHSRADRMRYDWRITGDVKTPQLVFQRSIGHCHALVLAQML
jgi:hypothetical protein